MTKKKSKTFLEDGGQRLVLATVAGCKTFSEAFTKYFDTYRENHDASEKKEDGKWVDDLLRNTSKSMEEMIKHMAKIPKDVVDTYLDEDDEDDEDDLEEKEKGD